jgi:hypothetical protein
VNNTIRQKLTQNFSECDLHIQRLGYAHSKLTPTLPLSAEAYGELTEDQIAHIDQYLYRFSKLQDAMGRRLFRNLLVRLGEDIENLPFIDIFNKMEKLQILQDKNQWLFLRELRNSIAHEYGENQESQLAALNQIFKSKNSLSSIYTTLKSRWQNLEH